MKRLSILFCVLILIFTGCGGNSEKTVVPADAAKAILNEVDFKEDLVEAQGELANTWYTFDDKVIEHSVYICASGASAEEIAVIKTSDVESAKAIVEKRIDDLEFNFKNYNSEEMVKISNPVIVTRGDTVFLVVCDDSAQAQKAIDNLYK